MSRRIALFAAGAFLIAPAPLSAQLAFAIIGLGIVGMVHGAGDLAIVEPASRRLFLGAYGIVSLITLLWWTADPSVALPLFLAASAVHFGIEDVPNGPLAERIARGAALVAGPATLHLSGYAALLRTAGGLASALPAYVPALAAIGGAAVAMSLTFAWQKRDLRTAGGLVALIVLPPLIGFTLGFLILHALPQTVQRRDQLGCDTTFSYLKTVAPIFMAALFISGLVALLLLRFDPSGVRGLFAGIAALAVPHLLVTPWFEKERSSRRQCIAAPV